MSVDLQIEYWSADKLIPYARNPRKNDSAVERMASLIREFGFRVPVIAKSDGSVIDGHLRLKAAKKLGMDTVPVVLADDLTPAQVKALRLSINKSYEFAEWDFELLKFELDELKDLDFDLGLTGFDDSDRDEIDANLQKLQMQDPATSARKLGDKRWQVKPVLYIDEINVFESAIKATGERNRGKAIIKICEAYLEQYPIGQLDTGIEDCFAN